MVEHIHQKSLPSVLQRQGTSDHCKVLQPLEFQLVIHLQLTQEEFELQELVKH